MHVCQAPNLLPHQNKYLILITGSNYYRFDPQTEKVVQTGLIQSIFRPSTARPGMGIPNNLDASFFEHLTKTIFFFKNNLVSFIDWGLRKYNQTTNILILAGTRTCVLALFTPPREQGYVRAISHLYFFYKNKPINSLFKPLLYLVVTKIEILPVYDKSTYHYLLAGL